MSLRTFLQPRVTGLMTSPRTRELRRAVVEKLRVLRGQPHRILYFHQVDDPYSDLAAQLLEDFLARYDVELEVHLVGPPSDAAAPERERLVAWSRKDAADIATPRRLRFRDSGAQPTAAMVSLATRILAAAASARAFAALAPRLGDALWSEDRATMDALARDFGLVTETEAHARISRGNATREKLGHYLGATFHYGFEWYWGVDRLGYLERRLIELGAVRAADGSMVDDDPEGMFDDGLAAAGRKRRRRRPPLLAPRIEVTSERLDASQAGLTLEFFPSLRSPYSYIAMERTMALSARTGVVLRWRPVLPMVMRGLPVPLAKRLYITLDTAREAEEVGVPFGRVCDPVGKPVERAFSLYPFACSKGRGGEFLLAFCRASFAEGVDTGSDEGLRVVVTAAGLSWEEATLHLDREGWRPELEANREDMFAMGLWGVPSYRLRGPAGSPDFYTWGQDRLWLVEREIRRRA